MSTISCSPLQTPSVEEMKPGTAELDWEDGVTTSTASGSPGNSCASTPTNNSSESSWPGSPEWPSPTLSPTRSHEAFRHLAPQAFAPFDLEVAWHFCVQLGVQDVVGDDLLHALLEILSLLHRCGYPVDVTLTTFARAAVHCKDGCVRKILEESASSEIAQVHVCMHLFLAHAFLVDEDCELSTWQEHVTVLREGWEVKELSVELMRLFKQRNFILSVDDDELSSMVTSFSTVVKTKMEL